MRQALAVLVLAAALATSGCDAKIGDGIGLTGSLADGGELDAPSADADGRLTLTQTAAGPIQGGNSILCALNDDANGIHEIRESSFYRVFDLAELGYQDGLVVERVNVGVESSKSPTMTQTMTIRLHTLAGAFVVANLTPLGEIVVPVPDDPSPRLFEVPLTTTVPGNARLVVEYLQPFALDSSMYIGSIAGDQTAPGYWRTPDCSIAEPSDLAGHMPTMRIALEVVARLP